MLLINEDFQILVKSLVPELTSVVDQLLADNDTRKFGSGLTEVLKATNMPVSLIAEHTFEFIQNNEKASAIAKAAFDRYTTYSTKKTENAWSKAYNRSSTKYTTKEEIDWLKAFGSSLTCGVCRSAYEKYIQNTPPVISTNEDYRKWLNGAYNAVQMANRIVPLTEEELLRKYPIAKKIIIRSSLSLGDIVMLTAAVRDLHKQYPGKYITDVQTSCETVWDNNPYITKLKKEEAEVIECAYPLINDSNQKPYHFIHGYMQDLSKKLGISITPTLFKGDIHLSEKEKSEYPFDTNTPYWLIVSGGKFDYTIKWWETKRYQEVVDHYKGKIQFVQVGAIEHSHKGLNNVIDIRGRTTHRQLIQLIYHAQGVVCPVTSLMHLSAAIPPKAPRASRPCVVIAGGREGSHWEEYPTHRFLHTIGALPCCESGGCWKSRTVPLGDGDEKDKSLCTNLVGTLPKCMDMITSKDVIRAIETYYTGGVLKYLNTQEFQPYSAETLHG